MKDNTIVTHAGNRPFENHGIVNPPVYHASTVLSETLEQRIDRSEARVRYGRAGTPTTFALEDAMSALEQAHGTILASSGLAAITMAHSAFVQTGDHILVTDSTYTPTRNFCNQTLSRLGVETEYFDPLTGSGSTELIRENTRLVWTECPGSQTFDVQDLPAIVEAAHARDVIVLTDNTWSGGYFRKPLTEGVDVSVQAATKYIVGHSDVMMGTIACNEATFEKVRQSSSLFGMCCGPDDVYLALRGLRTISVRMDRHHESGIRVAEWLQSRPEVSQVMHPALPQDPGHELWKRDFTGASGLFGFVLKEGDRTKLAAMMDHMELLGMGSSWGGYESLLIPSWPEQSRTVTNWEVSGQCMRIHVGLEDPDDLIADLEAGFERMKKA